MRFLFLALLLLAPLQARAQTLTVFAAASLTDAMKDISTLWVGAGHEAPRLSFASSSTLAQQIEQGAPVNVFASADEKWMDYLAKANLIAPDTRHDLLGNDLVLIVPANHPTHVDIGPGFDLSAILGPDGRLSVGEAPAGIVYGTDAAVSKAVMVAGVFPASSHDPVTYPFAITKAGYTKDARDFMAFLASPAARAVWVRRGFKVE
jgi:molybdate transport system substrate-binding protein